MKLPKFGTTSTDFDLDFIIERLSHFVRRERRLSKHRKTRLARFRMERLKYAEVALQNLIQTRDWDKGFLNLPPKSEKEKRRIQIY